MLALLRSARSPGQFTTARAALTALVMLLAACASPPPPPPPPPPAPEPIPPFPAEVVWTARAEVPIDAGERRVAVEHIFQRLDVVERDSIGVRVRCAACPGSPEGYVDTDDIIYEAVPPGVAAWGELADFALALRTAAEANDLEALREVMHPDFSFSFVGPQNPAAALQVWSSESFATLERLPELLDGGLVTADDQLWVAPTDFVEAPGYRGLRTGMRRTADGRWEWLFLITGIGGL